VPPSALPRLHAETIAQKLPRRDDLSPLTDPMFVGRVLTTLPVEISQGTGAGTGWKGLGTTTEFLALE
jgi:type 2A phosphatase activator TIP41